MNPRLSCSSVSDRSWSQGTIVIYGDSKQLESYAIAEGGRVIVV